MIELIYGDKFLKSVSKLPANQLTKLSSLLLILREDPFDPRLHSKPLIGKLTGTFSFRITRGYRVLFRFIDPRKIQLIEAGDRKNIYK